MTPKRPSNKELLKVYKFFLSCKDMLRNEVIKDSSHKNNVDEILEHLHQFDWYIYHVLEREYYHLKNDVNVDEHKKAPLNLEC